MLDLRSWQSLVEYQHHIDVYWNRLEWNSNAYGTDTYDVHEEVLYSMSLDSVLGVTMDLYSNYGRPAKNQAQIPRSVVIFMPLFDQTPVKASLTAWVKEVLPSSPALIILIGCRSVEELLLLGFYYDLMDHLWGRDPTTTACRCSLPPRRTRSPRKRRSVLARSSSMGRCTSRRSSFMTL